MTGFQVVVNSHEAAVNTRGLLTSDEELDQKENFVPVYPYVSSQAALPKAFAQFRKSMPASVTSQSLQKFSIAPKNESYVINSLRFLGLIDADGNRVDDNTGFMFGDDATFQAGLEDRLKEAYVELFSDFGDSTFQTERSALTTWFRTTDKTTEIVGGRQATTFLVLAALAGHGELPAAPPTTTETKATPKAGSKVSPKPKKPQAHDKDGKDAGAKFEIPEVKDPLGTNSLGLTVRIEVTLPANGTPDVYDAIFASVRKHLIDRA